ncbi:MAG TPA: MFS transporter [Ktedonobacterales bacterium]|nr:MFS transporter [Ktedonobacterales bacterium]
MDAHIDTSRPAPARAAPFDWSILLPLALAQFIASYAATNMNVAINSIAQDLNTNVQGVQTTITFFTLTMAALMIPGSKLTDIWGRKFCFELGLIVYGIGALIAALAPGLGILMFGYSLLEGVGSALMIPPIYILATVVFTDLPSRARAFGIISAAAGIGSATGPLIGGLITSAISWRASFILQVLVVALIIISGHRRIADAGIQGARPHFDILGAVLSAAGLFFIVLGILQSGTYGWFTASKDFTIGSLVVIPKGGVSPIWLFVAIGALILLWFFLHIRSFERAGKEPLLASRLFRNLTSNLGLVTQNVQWLIMQGSFFVISVFLQTVRGYSALETGLILSSATVGILLTSSIAGRLAKRRPQRTLIIGGFVVTIAGTLLLILLAGVTTNTLAFLPGLFLIGAGVGVMLTSSVNVVQSAFPEQDQGEISGLSRSISNLGSSLGTAIVGSVLVLNLLEGNKDFGLALIVMVVFACIGLIAAILLPARRTAPQPTAATAQAR